MPDSLSPPFAALSDPTRRAILARLALGETSVKELAHPFALSPPSITKHLKVLERAGLIKRSREAQWRPCRPHRKIPRRARCHSAGHARLHQLQPVDGRAAFDPPETRGSETGNEVDHR